MNKIETFAHCMLCCIQGLIHAAETRQPVHITRKDTEARPRPTPRDPYMYTHPGTTSLAPYLFGMAQHNDMRSTLGLLPHQSIGGPPPR